MTPPTVLAVLTTAHDESFFPLRDAIAARGGRLLRFDTDRYPMDYALDVRPVGGCWTGTLTLPDGEAVDLQSLRSLWLKQLDPAAALPRDLPPDVGSACRRESAAALVGVLANLGVPIVDPPAVVITAENKPRQLAIAQSEGVAIPTTLLTNLAASARSMSSAHGPLITKLLHAGPIKGRSGRVTMATSAVEPDDLAALEDAHLTMAPSLFQARLEKSVEARALVVGDRVLTATVDAQQTDGATVDWRQGYGELRDAFTPIELPSGFAAALVRIAKRLGLTYGAVDLILTPDDEWVFLEINPVGDWGWLHACGVPVADALAELLLEQV